MWLMTRIFLLVGFLAALIIGCDACACTTTTHTPVLVHQFPNGTWAENIIGLANGSVYTTLFNTPELILLDPIQSNPDPITAANIATKTGLLGVAQPRNDIITVIAGSFTSTAPSTTSAINGSYAILVFTIDVETPSIPPVLRAKYPIPQAGFLDGLTALPLDPHHVLAGDSLKGVIWRINIDTGAVDCPISDPLLKQVSGSSTPGVNGLHASPTDPYLYFTNSAMAIFGRVLISSSGSQLASAETVVAASGDNAYDDFAISPDGHWAFLCNTPPDAISLVDIWSTAFPTTATIVAGGNGDTNFDHPVGATFGRGPEHSQLFISTAGAIEGLGGKTGGQVFKIDVKDLLGETSCRI
ncbi:hypothetical protein BGW36DRAFT_423039 [Talaromyces proteolyticus]|uniref:SMP-30/Gluconolactonase/LRE-like region domain-containing protein n=1 Tax=Talaromyces proteolyticus TaxID=1131652 RepID=A0AAD4KYU0_9EURO|nr:uncharacterized protein BGW36DRAFT_423039 [Talaromyces proteolyticus]KAH8703477.1 hypothetical protein BGW36DRAFT_423039 [Talaromyces proteolyticus]